jgi:dienelactone hydrolase
MHELIAELPDLFAVEDGSRLATTADWRRRRAELQELILGIEYGHLPPTPDAVRAEDLHPTAVKRLQGAKRNIYRLNIEGGAKPFWFYLDVMTPPGDGPFPVVINGDNCWRYLTDEVISEVLARGYVLASFNRTEIVPDNYRKERDSALYNVYPEGDFSALSAWAWGYHRAVDFLLTQDYVRPEQISIVGHSRGGKCVLLAGATDERIALTAPNDSGCGGAGSYLWQGEECEKLADLVRAVPYWLAAKAAEYVDREEDLPFDQHFLKAMVAPRALLSTEALGDLWADPSGTYQTFDAAREAYRFLGAEEKIGIWYREGEHSHGIVDWKAFLDFADWQFKGIEPATRYDVNPFPEMERAFSWTAPAR